MPNYTHSAFWASGTYVSVVLSMLVRNIIFARMLNPQDFAIALTFGVVLSFFEYLSNFGHELLMQRSKDGDEPLFQATMHAAMVMRGIIVAIFVVLIAPFIPEFLQIPHGTFNYALLAIIPLINGFAHLDPQRLHRLNDFKPSAKISLIADCSSICIALLSVAILESYWAFYISFIFRHSVSTFLSHSFASRPYRLALNKDYLVTLCKFGIPLLLVGALKYFGTEVDKALIARYVGLGAFTVYFLTLMVTANAANIISIGLSKIFVRRISTASSENLATTACENGLISLYLVLPILFTVTLFGETIILLVFGAKYATIPYLLPAVVVLILTRQLSNWLNQIVVGSNDTKLMLYADIARILVLVALLPLAVSNQDVRLFALCFAASEIAYFVFLNVLMSRSIDQLKPISLGLFGIVTLSLFCFATSYWLNYESSALNKIPFFTVGMLAIIGLFNTFSVTCRDQTKALVITMFNLATRSR